MIDTTDTSLAIVNSLKLGINPSMPIVNYGKARGVSRYSVSILARADHGIIGTVAANEPYMIALATFENTHVSADNYVIVHDSDDFEVMRDSRNETEEIDMNPNVSRAGVRISHPGRRESQRRAHSRKIARMSANEWARYITQVKAEVAHTF